MADKPIFSLMDAGKQAKYRKGCIKQIQVLRQLLTEQLRFYQNGEFDKGHAYFSRIEHCLQKRKSLKSFSKREAEAWQTMKKECQVLSQKIDLYLEKQKKLLKRDYLSAQVDLAFLRLEQSDSEES